MSSLQPSSSVPATDAVSRARSVLEAESAAVTLRVADQFKMWMQTYADRIDRILVCNRGYTESGFSVRALIVQRAVACDTELEDAVTQFDMDLAQRLGEEGERIYVDTLTLPYCERDESYASFADLSKAIRLNAE